MFKALTCDGHTTPEGSWAFVGWGGVRNHSTFAGETFQSISDQKTARLASKGDFRLISKVMLLRCYSDLSISKACFCFQ